MEENKNLTEVSSENENSQKRGLGFKKKVIIIIAALLAAIAFCVISVGLLQPNDNDGGGRKVYPPIDEALLSDTKPEGFDIMEYDEYTQRHNISVFYKKDSIKQSITDDVVNNYGEAFAVVYNVIVAIRNGDATTYNFYMGKKEFEKDSFTQQQIYDILITFQPGYTDDEEVTYDKAVFKVEYKIHENNGTYRNNIESDASRPIYFIVDNSSGEMRVTDMIEP